ncbi:hypothetical protein Tco_1363517 [Tanacetum coccineum]
MVRMLQGIDREDLETLWKLVKTKHGDIMPKDEHERVLWGDLKVLFEPDIKSDVWRNLQGYKKKYAELCEQEQLQDECDVQATNIVLQGLLLDVYALVNHFQSAKDIWERIKLLMKGTELSYQERKCKLYNEFDKFSSVKAKSLHEYYLRFDQLINDMHTIGMTMQQVQLYAYLSQHEGDENEARLLHETYSDPLALVANHQTQSHSAQYPQQQSSTPQRCGKEFTQDHRARQAEFPQLDSGLAVPSFLPGDDPIACLNKAMEFMVTVQQDLGRQGKSFAGTGTKGNATSLGGNNVAATAFLVDPGIADGQDTQPTIIQNATLQIDDLDAYDLDCDDISSPPKTYIPFLKQFLKL